MDKPLPRRATRADVAREAGTSVAVVSYVVNNGPRPVAQATRKLVLAAIEKTGYRPNNVARALASGTSKTYGLVLPNVSNVFLASLAHALQQEALANDMVMLLGDSGDSRQRELQLLNTLLSQQVDGLIYISVDRHPWIELLQESGTPFLMLDSVDPALGVSVLRVDEQAASRQLTAHLLSHGYRQVGIVTGPQEMLNTQERLTGWREALADVGLQENPAWMYTAPFTREGGYQAAQQMLQGQTRPRALFTSNEAQAIGLIRGLAEQGLRVPEDVALVCFNGTGLAAFQVPSLTCARQPVEEMAKAAISMLRGWKGKPTLREFSHRLEPGESCGCQSARKDDNDK